MTHKHYGADPKLPFGSNYCQCPACGAYFTSPYSFDLHRADSGGKRVCRKPGELRHKNGKPMLAMNKKGYWASARAQELRKDQKDD